MQRASKGKTVGLPEVDEMIVYRALFGSREQLSDYAQKEHFRGICDEAKKNINMPQFENKFSTVQELMEFQDEK